MSQEDPITILIIFAGTLYLATLWLNDYRRNQKGTPNPRALPGASPASLKITTIGILGALIILGAETSGEYVLGISEKQSNITWLYLLAMISASFLEELIFRGYLVIAQRGKHILLLSIAGFSLLFALVHPFLWSWQDGSLQLDLTPKGYFSTAIVLLNSLWFYALRFMPLNVTHSIIPCIAAHLSSNLGVFAIKLIQGHVTGLY